MTPSSVDAKPQDKIIDGRLDDRDITQITY